MNTKAFKVVDTKGKLIMQGNLSNLNAWYDQQRFDYEVSRSEVGNLITIVWDN